MKEIAKKSRAPYYLNIIIIVVIFLTSVFLFATDFLRITEGTSIIFICIMIAFIIAPLREIMNTKKRNETIIYKKGNVISFTDMKNDVTKLTETSIVRIKKSKAPFIRFGTLVIYTDTHKIKCQYIENVDQVFGLLQNN